MLFGLGGVIIIVFVMRTLFGIFTDMTSKPVNKAPYRRRGYFD